MYTISLFMCYLRSDSDPRMATAHNCIEFPSAICVAVVCDLMVNQLFSLND